MKQEKSNIWLLIYNRDKHYQYFKYFETEFEKDKYKRQLKFIPYLMLIEDSSDINWNYS